MVVLLTFVVLAAVGAYLLVRVRIKHLPCISWSALTGWSKFAWVSSLVLMAAGIAYSAFATATQTTPVSMPGVDPDEMVAITPGTAFYGTSLILLLCFLIAFWQPTGAASLLALTAVVTPMVLNLQAVVSAIPSGSLEQSVLMGEIWVAVIVFSIPACLVGLLLLTVSFGRDLQPPASDETTDTNRVASNT